MVIMNNANTTERLIQEVRSRPPLWDQRNLNYHNRVVVNALWQDIADLLQVNKETVKVKWKGLRDTYRRELKKQRSTANVQNGGGENARDPSWTHYSSMNFLREYMGSSSGGNNNSQNDLFHFQGWPTDDMTVDEEAAGDSPTALNEAAFASCARVKPPSITSPVPSSGDDSTVDVKIESRHSPEARDIVAAAVAGESLSSSSPPLPLPPSALADHRTPQPSDNDDDNEATKKRRPISRLARLKEQRLRSRMHRGKQLHHQPTGRTLPHQRNGLPSMVGATAATAADDSDDDLYFFKSLIPYVKGLPPTRKLYLRSEIHNLVLREIVADTQSNGSSSHSQHHHHHHHTVIPLEHVTVGLNA